MAEHMESAKENEALNLSCESSDFEDSSGDGLEDDKGLLPYQFEPYAMGESSDEESSDTQSETYRLDSAAGCSCASCLPMPTNRECRCCLEIPEMESEVRKAGVTCITSHPGFQTVCLDVYVLKTAYFQYRQQYGRTVADLNNMHYDTEGFVLLGDFGLTVDAVREHMDRLTCGLANGAVLAIRKQFPSVDGKNTGYLEPE